MVARNAEGMPSSGLPRIPNHAVIEKDFLPSQVDMDRLGRVLGLAVTALEEEQIPYALIGGVASSGLGRPRTTHDIDVFVKPQDAPRALRALADRGFETEETDYKWIFKGFLDGIQVDVIFNTVGGIYLDREMLERSVEGKFAGQQVRFVPPEDLLIIKALVHDEATPRHWFDALGILAVTELDWDYLIRRARRAQNRVLSLLLYAQSVDIHVPARVIRSLFYRSFES
jgi:predicted nucleotidyltransferase